jgi:lipid II:glycine glycyltransferase (peptidoglycan interpeptide bridge formation enzyme)
MYDVYSETHSQGLAANSVDESNDLWSELSDQGRFKLKEALTPSDLTRVLELYGLQQEVSFLQHPEWDKIVSINGKVLYFTFESEGKLLAYAVIRFPNPRIATIAFGPVAVSKEAALAALQKIVESVRSTTKAWYLSVQLPWQTGEDTEFLELKLNQEFNIKTFSDKRNWSSSAIDTSLPNEELLKAFSKNHRRSLKKADKLGLEARICETEEEIRAFNDIYVRMYKVRGQNIDGQSNLEEYLRLNNFFQKTGNGFFFGVFQEGTMIGGMIIIRQGDYGFYHHSASDPDHRKIPVLHTGVFSILDALREKGIRYFDFGGYNHMVDETDQVYNINRFKDGFTKDYLYYPQLMYFEFVPNAVGMLESFQKFKDIVKKFIRR